MAAASENALKFNLVRAEGREIPVHLSTAGRHLTEEPSQHWKWCVKASGGAPRSQWSGGRGCEISLYVVEWQLGEECNSR